MSSNEDSTSFKVERKSVSRTSVKNGEDENEYIEANNYEESCLKNKKDIEDEKNYNLLVYPTDRLSIKSLNCFNNSYIIKSLENTDKDLEKKHLKDIYNQYKRESFIEITRNYPQYEGYPEFIKKENKEYIKDLPSLSFNSFKNEEDEENKNDHILNPLASLTKYDSEDICLNYLKYSGVDTEHIVKEKRKDDRHKLFHLFSDISDSFDLPIPWYKQEYIKINGDESNKILIEIKSFKSDFLNDEPLFFEANLVDTESKTRISENFYFNINKKETLEKYGLNTDLPDSNDKMAKKALFTIDNRINLKTVYLIIKIKKILEGNLIDINDRYNNPDKQKLETNKKCQIKKSKDEELIRDTCKRLSNYRQPLAYAAFPLFEDKNLISNKSSFYFLENEEEESKLNQSAASGIAKPEEITKNSEGENSQENSYENMNSIKNKENIIQKLNKYSRDFSIDTFVKISDSKLLDEDICSQIINEKNKKQKYIPNLSLDITLTKIEDDTLISKRINTSLFPVIKTEKVEDKSINSKLENLRESCESIEMNKSDENMNSREDQEPVVEIQEFLPDKLQILSTLSTYVNNIYVYPRFINLTKSELKGRNIACKVMMFDSTNEAEPLNTVYCKTKDRQFTNFGMTSICYHRREAFFNDEIKFVIPNTADFSKLHIQFIFYHVACKKSLKKENENPDNIIGYTYLKLFDDDLTLKTDGDYNLPISTDISKIDYLNNVDEIKWADKQKALFTVRIKTLTNIHTTDTNLGKYFINYDNYINNKTKENTDKLIESYKEISNTSKSNLLNYFTVILNEYFDILCSEESSIDLKKEGFTAINSVIQCVMTENQKMEFKRFGNQALAYVNKKFQISSKWKLPIYIEILNIWNEILKNKSDSHTVCSGFFFEIIVKSIVQAIQNSNKEFGKMNYKNSINNKFYDSLQNVIPNISEEVKKQNNSNKDLNHNLAYFLMDCLSFTDKKIIFDLIKDHCKTLSTNDTHKKYQIEMKFDFLRIVCSHEFFVPLNLPFASYNYTKFERISTIKKLFWERHYLVGLLLHEVFKSLKCKDILMNNVNIKALNTLMYVLFKHSFDDRYQDKESQERIALMYFPLIIMSIDYLQGQNQELNNSKNNLNNNSDQYSNNNNEIESDKSINEDTIKKDKSINNNENNITDTNDSTVKKSNTYNTINNIDNTEDEKNRLLGISLLYILQNVNESVRMNWIKNETLTRYRGFILTLKFLVEIFHYKGRDEIIKKFVSLNNSKQQQSAKQSIERRYNTNNLSNYESDSERLRSGYNSRRFKTEKGYKTSSTIIGSIKSQKYQYSRSYIKTNKDNKLQELSEMVGELTKSKESFFNNVFLKMEGYLAGEVVLIILNIAEDIMCDISQSTSPIELEPLYTLFNLYTFMFEKSHSQRTLLNMFISLKIFINRFRYQIFIEKTPYCSRLCDIGLQYSCSSLPIVRQYCAGFLYLCLKLNYIEIRRNKIKIIESLKEKDKIKKNKRSSFFAFGLFKKSITDEHTDTIPNITLSTVSDNNLLSTTTNQPPPFLTQESAPKLSTLKQFQDIRKQSFISLKHTSSFTSANKLPDIPDSNRCSQLEMEDSNNAIGNFNRTKIQMMVALSKLDLDNNKNIKKSLATIKQYNTKDPYKSKVDNKNQNYIPKEIEEQIDELMDRLYCITRDLVEIKKYKDDTEMKVDYIHRVAIGFTAPDLRISFMERLKNIHIDTKYVAEAAYCSLYTSKIIFNQLVRNNLITYDEIIPENIWEKCFNHMNNPDDTDTIEDYSSNYINEQGFINSIKETCNLLSKAQLYEVCDYLYKLIIPLYKNRKDYTELTKIYTELENIYKNIDQGEQSGKRIFGTYYRIGFYGKKFNEIDGNEYIYRELGVTPLSEMYLKLNNLYKTKLNDNFKIIQDSNKVDVSKLDPSINYIQITHVEPYFDDEELTTRQTSYEKANGLNKFIYQTPYTNDGKAHGSVSTQCKRKTILYTSEYFPNVTRRLLVDKSKTNEFDLTPLQVSIEEISERCKKFQSVIFSPIPNMKGLQMVLQGSVRIQVNSGPLEIANSFLPPEKVVDYPEDEIQKLKYIFKEFLVFCQMALKLNKNMIGSDQAKYQEDLEEGFENLKNQLHKYLFVDDDNDNCILDEDIIQSESELDKDNKYLFDSMKEATKDINLFFSKKLESKESEQKAPGVDTNSHIPSTTLIA